MAELLKSAIEEIKKIEDNEAVNPPQTISEDKDSEALSDEIITKNDNNSKEKEFINTSIDKELLPSPIKEYFIDVSERLELSFELVVTTGLAYLSNLISDKLCLIPTKDISYKIIPNLWGCIISQKGTRKTPLFKAFTDIIYKKHFAYNERYEEEKAIYEARLKTLSAKIKQLAKAEAEGDSEKVEELQETINKLKQQTKEKPKSKYLILSDATKEKITDILSNNRQGFLIYQDEISKMLYSFEKDKEMRSLLLESWSGASSYTIARINRGDVNVKKLTIGLFGGIQPEIYHKLIIGDKDNITSGFNDRFQLIYIAKDFKYKISDKERNELIYNQFEELITKLIDRELHNYTKAKEYTFIDDLYFLQLTEEAKAEYKKFLEGVNNILGDEYPQLKGFFSKLDKLLGGIAILIYTAEALQEEKEDNFIPLSVLNRAIEITKFYIYQAIEAFNISSTLEYQNELDFEKKRNKVLNYTLKQKLPIKLREIYRANNVTQKEALQILEPYYLIEREGKGYIIKSQKA